MNTQTSSLWQMTLIGLRYLNSRKLRTLLTTLAIVFGVAMIFAINLVLPSVLETFNQQLSTVAGADISLTSLAGDSFAPDQVLAQAASVAGVDGVSGSLRRQFTLPTLGSELGETAQIDMIGIDPETASSVRNFVVSEGRFIEAGDTGAAVLPAGIADFAPQLQVGTVFPLVTSGGLKLYTVVGLLAAQGSTTAPEMFVSLADAQAAFNQPGLINTIEVSIEPGADREAITAALLNTLGTSFKVSDGNAAGGVLASAAVGFGVLNLLGLIALFLGAFLIFNTFRTIVVERRRDLGMLRAIGATRRQITTLILVESVIQGVIGSVIGLILGYLMAVGMVSVMYSVVEQFSRGMSFGLRVNVTASAVIIPAVLGIVISLVAGYLPARSASHTSPLEALRPESAAAAQRTSRWSLIGGAVLILMGVALLLTGSRGAVGGAMLFLIGAVVAAPALVVPASKLFSPLLTLWFAREGDLARGNLTRQPGRAAITGGTLMIGLATLVMIVALVGAIQRLFTDLAEGTFRSDIVMLPQSIGVYTNVIGADPTLAEDIRALPDVATVATLRYASGTADGDPVELMGVNPADYAAVSSLEYSSGEENLSTLDGGRNAILTSVASTTLGLETGDTFVMQTANSEQTYTVVGVANDILTIKIAAMYISQENLAADFNKTEDVMLMINLTPGADSAAAFAEVETLAQDYPQFTPRLTGEYRTELVETTVGIMWLFYAVAILILIPAALGLLNTLTINVLERTREIGVVRAVGGSRAQVRRIVTSEALLLGIFGAALGVIVGVAMSYGFISAFSVLGWDVPYEVPVMGIIAAVVVGVLLALFASILPARSAAKLDIIRALQYE